MNGLTVCGVDTGLLGGLATLDPQGRIVDATLLRPGKRADGWRTPSPPELSRVYQQMRDHIVLTKPEAIVYEQVGATRGIAAARSLFMCEGILLEIADSVGVPVFGVMQATLRVWVKELLGIEKWEKGKSKLQVLDAMSSWALSDLIDAVEAKSGKVPERRRPDLADAYHAARWGQMLLQVGGGSDG